MPTLQGMEVQSIMIAGVPHRSASTASPEVTVQSSSNPAFKNMEKVIGAQQQAAPSAEYLDQMYQQPAYQAPAA